MKKVILSCLKMKYLKRGWDRKKGRGNKDFKKWGQAGSRGGWIKNGREPPYELCLIFNLNNLLSLACLSVCLCLRVCKLLLCGISEDPQ